MARIRLPDGTLIQASPIADRRTDDGWREFGLYLDPAWLPAWPAVVLDWPDFGLPASSEEAYQQILAAFERARAGVRVEVGCLGGLGRTGTVLACFVVLCSGLDAAEAVRWVRAHYDSRAIETREQEQWVEWFAARHQKDGNED